MENSVCQEQLVVENMEIPEYSMENAERVDAAKLSAQAYRGQGGHVKNLVGGES